MRPFAVTALVFAGAAAVVALVRRGAIGRRVGPAGVRIMTGIVIAVAVLVAASLLLSMRR